MTTLKKIGILFVWMCTINMVAQTAGFNYQVLILNTEEIQIPGTDVSEKNIPLRLEEVVIRFRITNVSGLEYAEEHQVTTDENGMISLIVGEGTPIDYTFDDIQWDGALKLLHVALNILSNNNGFVSLDQQKILYIPSPKALHTLPVVSDDSHRDTDFETPKTGDQVWNQFCDCLEIFNGVAWVSQITNASNGITNIRGDVSLGGSLNRATAITTSPLHTLALKGLQTSISNSDLVIVTDTATGILRQKSSTDLIKQSQIVFVSEEGQLEFNTPTTITSPEKIDVYRNGIRVDFTVLNENTIQLEQEAICYKNDKIRIVQLH